MKRFILFVFTFLGWFALHAQYYYDRSKNPDKTKAVQQSPSRDFDHFFFFSWDTNKPLSNTDFVGSTSSLGTRLGFRKRINNVDQIWAGADLGWSVYKEYFPYQTYTSGTKSVSTDFYDYAVNLNLTASIDYFFLPMDKIVNPYVGLNLGVAYDKFSYYYNIYGASNGTFGLLLRPEAGLLVGFGKNSPWRLKGAIHYDYSTNSDKDTGYKNFSNIGLQIGIVKMAW
ncbi:MAG TPA: hypothetical protein DGG95_10860 [Cytophagales bacterium]|nr:hypothetical protein [Cytophagales bacterium]